MNAWKPNMSPFVARFNPGLAIKVVVLFVVLMSAPGMAQIDRYSLSEELGVDLVPMALPTEMEITGLDLSGGRIYLDEEGYSIALFLRGESGLEQPQLETSVDLQSLTVGDLVIVETDGTAPSAQHYPYIIAIARP